MNELSGSRDVPDLGQITGPELFRALFRSGLWVLYPPKQVGMDLKGWRRCTTLFSLSRHVSALVRQVETFTSTWAQRGVRPAQPPSLPFCTSQRCSAGPLGFRATEACSHRRHGGALNHHRPPPPPSCQGGLHGYLVTTAHSLGPTEPPAPEQSPACLGPPEFIPGRAPRSTVFLTSAGDSCWLADAPF